MKKYYDYYISDKTVATAIFDFLEKRKFKVNRKRGLQNVTNISGYKVGGYYVTVEEKNE